jgi:tRNA(fMet)-specific endonuclease VapC
MKKLLLDTNAFTRFLGGDEKTLAWLAQADLVYMSVFVLGELYAGFRAGAKDRENRRLLDGFLDKSSVSVLQATRETAEIFGLVKNTLRKSGRLIPINDIWIAAHTLETGSILLTYNRHFSGIPGLRLWDEVEP